MSGLDPDRDGGDRFREHQHKSTSAATSPDPQAVGWGLSLELEKLCRTVTERGGAAGAVVVLMSYGGSETVIAASDSRARHLAGLELSVGEGPNHDAFSRARPVLTPDMGEAAKTTWPGYGAAASAAGLGAAFAFPLHVGAARFGVLAVYFTSPTTLSQDQVDAGLTLAGRATELLLDSTRPNAEAVLDLDRQSPREFRSEIYQAQGMVMVALGVGLGEALARMRAHAFATEQDLAALSADIVAGTTHLANDRA